MAGTVTTQTTDVTLAETGDAADWDDIGGGQGSGQSDGSLYQGSEARGRRIDNAVRGFSYDSTTGVDISGTGEHVIFQVQVTQPNLLNADGIELLLGDSATPKSGNWDGHFFDVAEYPPAASWLIIVVDPTRTRDTGSGTLALSSVRQWGCEFDIGDVGGTSYSCLMDAVRYTDGGLLVDGGTVPSPAVFDDFVTADEGTVGNRYGIVQTFAGTVACNGRLTIADATATIFDDSGFSINFGNQELAASDFMGVTVDLQNASTDVDFGGGSIRSGGSTVLGDFIVTGTSGEFDADGTVFDRLRAIDLTSACTLIGCKISNSGAVTANSACTLTGTAISATTAASALVWDLNTDPDGYLDDMSFVSDGSSHAIEFGTTSPLTLNLEGQSYSGYTDGSTGNETIWIRRTSGTVTINITGGGGTPSIRTDGATVVVNNTVSHVLTNLPTTAEVTYVKQSDGSELFHVETVGVTGSTTYNYNYVSDTLVDILIHDVDNNVNDIDNVTLGNTDQSIPATYEVDRVYYNP